MLKLLGGAATLVGAVTGIGTIVGWASSSESFADVATTAAGWAGMAYLAITGLLALVLAAAPAHGVKAAVSDTKLAGRAVWQARLVLATGALAFALILVSADFDPDAFTGFGFVALGLVVLIVAVVAWERRATAPSRRQQCPDCAEWVKTEARVCRHCGYRFAPPLDGSRRP